MSKRMSKNRGGAPRGNQNARKHGYYSKVLTPQQLQDIPTAASLAGLDLEIAVARLKLQSIIENGGLDQQITLRALSTLSRMIKTQELIRTGHNTAHASTQPPVCAHHDTPIRSRPIAPRRETTYLLQPQSSFEVVSRISPAGAGGILPLS